MDTSHIDLYRIAADIWAALLGMELKPNPASDSHDPDQLVVNASVQIAGDWTGAVSVQCSHAAAVRAAAAMFAMEPDEVTDEEVADTVGELANVAGGNVKSELGGTCQLSLPSVTTGRDYRLSILGARLDHRTVADADGDLVVVSLFESS